MKNSFLSSNDMNDLGRRLKQTCDCADILVVDDNNFNIQALQSLLSLMGYEKTTYSINGTKAIVKIREKAKSTCCKIFKLVIIDQNMPHMSGIEVAQEIHRMVDTGVIPKLYVVLSSANDMRDEVSRLDYVDDFLSKPIDLAKLKNLMRTVGV